MKHLIKSTVAALLLSTAVMAQGVPYHTPNTPGYGPTNYQSGPFYTMPANNLTTGVIGAINTLYAEPFYSSSPQVWTKISVDITTGITGNCELGVYADQAGTPGSLITDAGSISSAVTGQIELTGKVIPFGVGVYWLAVGCSALPTFEISSLSIVSNFFGFSNGTTNYSAFHVAWTYAANSLPATFGTAIPGTAQAPLVYLRF